MSLIIEELLPALKQKFDVNVNDLFLAKNQQNK